MVLVDLLEQKEEEISTVPDCVTDDFARSKGLSSACHYYWHIVAAAPG
jgi:hypothetical protein